MSFNYKIVLESLYNFNVLILKWFSVSLQNLASKLKILTSCIKTYFLEVLALRKLKSEFQIQ